MQHITDHHTQCPNCQQQFDRRDLSQVMHHEFGKCVAGLPVQEIPHTGSRRIGDSVEWTRDKKPLDLN